MGRPLASLSLAVLIAAPALAHAQEATAADRPAAPFQEVERGLAVGSAVGAAVYFSVPGEGETSAPLGSLIGVTAGYDVTPRLQLGAVFLGQSIGADVTYRGVTDDDVDPKRARGDFHSLLVGPSLRYAFVALADENGIDRTFFYGKAAGGLALNRPVGVLAEDGFFVTPSLGVEYFTRLRHFSVGLEVGLLFTLVEVAGELETASGLSVLPHLAYTF